MGLTLLNLQFYYADWMCQCHFYQLLVSVGFLFVEGSAHIMPLDDHRGGRGSWLPSDLRAEVSKAPDNPVLRP